MSHITNIPVDEMLLIITLLGELAGAIDYNIIFISYESIFCLPSSNVLTVSGSLGIDGPISL